MTVDTPLGAEALLDLLQHEIIGPATYIIGATEDILSADELSRRSRAIIENISSAAYLQLQIASGIRFGALNSDIAPARVYNPTKIDIQRLFRSVSHMTRLECHRQGVRNDNIRALGRLPTLFIDRSALSQIIFNLFINAIKYCNKERRDDFFISLDCQMVKASDLPPERRLAYEKRVLSMPGLCPKDKLESGHLLLFVDNGLGVPHDLGERIFERGFRAPGMEQYHARGAGLGLWISRKIAEDHLGDIWLENASNPTTFGVFLPVALESKAYTLHRSWAEGSPT